MKKKDLAREYADLQYNTQQYIGESPNLLKGIFGYEDIMNAFNAGRSSVIENIPELKWYKESDCMKARTLFGIYSFNNSNALWFYAYRGVNLFLDTYKTFEDAKKVAYNDYKAWIRQALEF